MFFLLFFPFCIDYTYFHDHLQWSDRLLYTFSIWWIHEFVNWGLNGLLYLVYHFDLFSKYKINGAKYPSGKLVKEAAINSIVSKTILGPIATWCMIFFFKKKKELILKILKYHLLSFLLLQLLFLIWLNLLVKKQINQILFIPLLFQLFPKPQKNFFFFDKIVDFNPKTTPSMFVFAWKFVLMFLFLDFCFYW